MKEIIFRGKQSNTGEWIYGDLAKFLGGSPCIMPKPFFATRDYGETDDRGQPIIQESMAIGGFFPVVPETIGQFIGVKGYTGEYKDRHKNELMLFEGDVVEAWSEGWHGTFVIKFRNEASPSYILSPAFQNSKFWSIHGSDLGRLKEDYYDDLKVIGNVHDNPELIPQRN